MDEYTICRLKDNILKQMLTVHLRVAGLQIFYSLFFVVLSKFPSLSFYFNNKHVIKIISVLTGSRKNMYIFIPYVFRKLLINCKIEES